MPREKQGPAIVLSLGNEAHDAILALEEEEISTNIGADIIIKRLDTIFKWMKHWKITLPLKHLQLSKDHTI